jgi:hypothetical protein
MRNHFSLRVAILSVAGLIIGWFTLPVYGVTVELSDLQLVSPSDPDNVLTVQLAPELGAPDTQQSTLSGTLTAQLELESIAEGPEVTGLTFIGGTISATDMEFRLLAGLVRVNTVGLAGPVSTPSPPAVVSGGRFAADEHLLTLNQGTITAPGTVIDMAQDPLPVTGIGFGRLSLNPVDLPRPGAVTYEVEVRLPVEVETTTPVGNLLVDITASGQLKATDQFTLVVTPLEAGDANQDLAFSFDDVFQVLGRGKYETGAAATWGAGDWSGAPGGAIGEPPIGDGRFDFDDVFAALATGNYETGPYGAGDLGPWPVPEPAAAWLLGGGLLLLSVRRTRGAAGPSADASPSPYR